MWNGGRGLERGPLCSMFHGLRESHIPRLNPGGSKGRGPGFHTIRTPGFAQKGNAGLEAGI